MTGGRTGGPTEDGTGDGTGSPTGDGTGVGGGRLGAVRAAMAEAGVDALVLRPSPDFRFLGGTGQGFLVVTPAACEETDDPGLIVPAGARRVGVDPEMRVRELFGLSLEAELVPATAVLAPLRLRKEPDDVEAVARAARAAGAVLAGVRELAWFGATERAMARRLAALLLESGCEEILSVRVAAGEHTARPAHRPGERVINPGDALLVSLCGRWEGHCAEVARVFAVAEPPEDFEAMYSVVLAAHAAAQRSVRPGVPASEVAAAVREVIDGSGYGRFAAPHAGRGIGRGHQEGPWLRAGDDTPLGAGMTLCVEPAIYVPELFGARVADVVACGPGGASPLHPGVVPVSLWVLDR
ncbi:MULTISPECIES: M24 family metallopeptidase [unclassified Nonomuraea]|uniref:M24 family metallopeptidase n=1 Tax=unclassified Nonomuraea TaxID=2593643 RepID=UPI0033F8E9E8